MTTYSPSIGYEETRRSVAVATFTGWMAVAGLASLGAGAIHAAAIGVHAEHRAAAITFVVVAALQLGWGGLALVRSGKLVGFLGVLINLGAFAGWVVAKTAGLWFIPGLDEVEPVQTADGLAAGLALASVLLVGWTLWTARRDARPARPPMVLASVGLAGLTVLGMVAAGTHVHAHGAAGHTHGAADGHSHAATVPPVPYDPSRPIDLSGVPGVTPAQQAAAENLVAVTVVRLPQWSDPEVALAAGFHSIGDGFTGIEHFVNDEFRRDDVILDPDRPESLVYDTSSGGRRLVAAMYMLNDGQRLQDVPDIGGPLMQWHIHNNLCFTTAGTVAGITDGEGNCHAPLVGPELTPMIHVWIEPHPCGPFAALEGIGGGQIAEGETRLCDHAHGSSG
jgi:hypothetical protein